MAHSIDNSIKDLEGKEQIFNDESSPPSSSNAPIYNLKPLEPFAQSRGIDDGAIQTPAPSLSFIKSASTGDEIDSTHSPEADYSQELSLKSCEIKNRPLKEYSDSILQQNDNNFHSILHQPAENSNPAHQLMENLESVLHHAAQKSDPSTLISRNDRDIYLQKHQRLPSQTNHAPPLHHHFGYLQLAAIALGVSIVLMLPSSVALLYLILGLYFGSLIASQHSSATERRRSNFDRMLEGRCRDVSHSAAHVFFYK